MRIPVIASTLVLVVALAGGSAALEPVGELTFSGSGASLLPSTTFVPATWEGTEASWGFFDAGGVVGVLVVLSDTDPSGASFVSVAEDGGETFGAIGLFGPVAGVTIEGNTVTFVDVAVPLSGATTPQDLIVNGSLTRDDEVGAGKHSLGELKRSYATGR